MKIAVATKNPNKAKEFTALFNLPGVEFVSMSSLGFDGDIEENADTFEQNALIKAKFICDKFSIPAIADDSGLCVDALDGAPGIYSARYASRDGKNSSDSDNIEKLLLELDGVENRTAQFVCAMAFCAPDGTQKCTSGICRGRIEYERKGTSGFGYDPVFYCDAICKTFGETSHEEKNKVSHRAIAVKQMSEIIKSYLNKQDN